jgi:hypothetical protein
MNEEARRPKLPGHISLLTFTACTRAIAGYRLAHARGFQQL